MTINILKPLLVLMLSIGYQHFAVGNLNVCIKVDNTTVKCPFIPGDVDDGISRVYVLIIAKDRPVITSANFSSTNWRKVKFLAFTDQEIPVQNHIIFQNGCFSNLNNLKELGIHIITRFSVFPDTFLGLDSVTVLDLSSCKRLKYKHFIQAINKTRNLPRLEKLVFSKFGIISGSYDVNDSLVEALLPRNITYLDLSYTQISSFNATALVKKLIHLTVLNLSCSNINYVYSHDLTFNDTGRIQVLDISYATLPSTIMPIIPGRFEIVNTTTKLSQLHPGVSLFFSPQTTNVSGVVPNYSSILIRNSTVILDIALKLRTENLVVRQNNLKRLDVRVICDKHNMSSFQSLDLSANQMEFLHPSFLSCMPNLEMLNLSRNSLFQMFDEDSIMFEMLLSGLLNLTYISLAENSLKKIPMKMFSFGKMVEIIDISRNQLQQVNFTLTNLENLKILDLSFNKIKRLDSLSRSHLDSILTRNNLSEHSVSIELTGNPLSCSDCECRHFLKWLVSSNLTDQASQNLQCINEKHHLESIGFSTLKEVNQICERKQVIVVGCVTAAVVSVVILVLIGILYTRKRQQRKMQNRVNVINRLQEGAGQHEFVVYLAYSSDDQDFVKDYILEPLRQNLQLMTGIDRELICMGDKHFNLGFDIQTETIQCLERSSVVLVMVSNNFCTSQYCHNELDEAYMRGKPIILMFKEHVDENCMMPTMKELYHNKARMLWDYEDGQYVLKSTWENVCTSVLELVQCDI